MGGHLSHQYGAPQLHAFSPHLVLKSATYMEQLDYGVGEKVNVQMYGTYKSVAFGTVLVSIDTIGYLSHQNWH